MAVGTGYRNGERHGIDEGTQSSGELVVDEAFAATLAGDFGIPEVDVRDALMGEPKALALKICGWAEEQGKAPIKKGEALTGWARKHKAGAYAKRGGPEGGAVRIPKRRERERFSREEILRNLERMGS